MATRGRRVYLIHTKDGEWLTFFDEDTFEYSLSSRIEDAKLFTSSEYGMKLRDFVYINDFSTEFIEQKPIRSSSVSKRKRRRV